MWALYVLLGSAALILLLLLAPIRLRFCFARGEFRLTLRVLGIPFRLLPRRKKPAGAKQADAGGRDTPNRKTRKKKKKKGRKSGEKPKKPNLIRRIFAENDLPDAIAITCRILRLLLDRALWVLRHVRFERMRLSLTLAGGDAADTALLYGRACAAVYPLLAFLQSNLRFSLKRADVRADFAGGKNEIRASGTVCLRLVTLLAALIVFAVRYQEIDRSEEYKHERSKH